MVLTTLSSGPYWENVGSRGNAVIKATHTLEKKNRHAMGGWLPIENDAWESTCQRCGVAAYLHRNIYPNTTTYSLCGKAAWEKCPEVDNEDKKEDDDEEVANG